MPMDRSGKMNRTVSTSVDEKQDILFMYEITTRIGPSNRPYHRISIKVDPPIRYLGRYPWEEPHVPESEHTIENYEGPLQALEESSVETAIQNMLDGINGAKLVTDDAE